MLWCARLSETPVGFAVRVAPAIIVDLADIEFGLDFSGVEAGAKAAEHELDAAGPRIRVQLPHHGRIARHFLDRPAEAIEQDHVDLEPRAKFELPLDAGHVSARAVAPVISPAVQFG